MIRSDHAHYVYAQMLIAQAQVVLLFPAPTVESTIPSKGDYLERMREQSRMSPRAAGNAGAAVMTRAPSYRASQVRTSVATGTGARDLHKR